MNPLRTVPASPLRPLTKNEGKRRLLVELSDIARIWAGYSGKTPLEQCRGVVFSVLALLDGEGGDFPAVDLVLRPAEDDKAWHQKRGENWTEDGTTFAEGDLHDKWKAGQ